MRMSAQLIKILPKGLLKWLKLSLIWVKVFGKVFQVLFLKKRSERKEH